MQPNLWQGERVRLRGVEPSDWEPFHQNDADSEAQGLCDRIYPPRSKEGSRQWVTGRATQEATDDAVFLAIANLAGELVGSISTSACNPKSGTFRYGLSIFRPYWRKGYASEAILLVLRYYFSELRYQKANAHIFSCNEPSIQLHQKLGFTQEGRLRRMVYMNGELHDEVIFGITFEEFKEKHAAALPAPSAT